MNPREDVQSLGTHFADRISAMIESGLLTYRHYRPWASRLTQMLDKPPAWVRELGAARDRPAAEAAARNFAFGDAVGLSIDDWTDEYVASLFLRHERRELSWATFLNEAGIGSDNSNSGMNACEYFYNMLNEYEESEFSEAVEQRQRAAVLTQYTGVIESVRQTYRAIR